MKRTLFLLIILTGALTGAAIGDVAEAEPGLVNPTIAEFNSYWYPNGAEISRFTLDQARYGEIHKGDAVFIFVTESMIPGIQVKADRPDDGDIPILKLNAVRKFFTGIYPYSVMTSVFSPVDARNQPLPLKITFSGQEWCGHVWAQLNLKEKTYRVESYSYFETEGDQGFTIEGAISEDALWNRIRIAPATLPEGRFQMIPGTLYSRFRHKGLTPLPAEARLMAIRKRSLEGRPLTAYRIRMPQHDRTLVIFFETEFPHRIQGWKDTYPDGDRGGARRLTTRADRTHTLMTDYWNKNSNIDRSLLKKLGVDWGNERLR